MREGTYGKLEQYSGYVETAELLRAGVTNRQIAEFVDEGCLERICHGHYWVVRKGEKKPKNYKPIEIYISSPRAFVCADSACYYLGLIKEQPRALSVATSRSDRSGIRMNFPVKRHYISKELFADAYHTVRTNAGNYNISDLDRSVCDCIRYRESIDPYLFELIIDSYRPKGREQRERLLEYAKRLRIASSVKKYIL